MKSTALSGPAGSKKAEVFAALEALAAELSLDELPELVGRLANIKAMAALRFSQAGGSLTRTPEPPLLTVEEVAAKLRISEQNVYARAKTDLRAAAVDVGPGQLRFDARAIERFIEARRRS